jgi:hypothetical protein
MANAFSFLHNYKDNPIYSPDYNFLQTALSYKQNKLDTNRAKLQNLADQYSMLNVHNDVDKKYLEDRLEQVLNITNKYANMDLSDDNFAKSLMANVDQVLDDKVKNAVVSTKIIEAEDKVWKSWRDKADGKYSERNHAYALAQSDRGRYEASKEAGAMYKGGAGFIEYRDLSKKLMDNIDKISKNLQAEWIEQGPQQGYFRSLVTKEAIDRNKMEGAISLLFDEKDKKQIGINAWSTYDDKDDAIIKEDWDRQYKPELDFAEKRVKELEVLREDKNSGISKQEIDDELNAWTAKRDKLKNYTYDEVAKTYGREGAYQALYNSKYMDTILDTYSYEPRVIDIKLDQVHAEGIKFAQKIKNDERNYELSKAKFLYQVEKDQQKAQATDETRFVTSENVQDTPDADLLKNEIQTIQAEESAAIKDMTNLFGGKRVAVEDYKALKSQLSDMGNLIGKTVTIGGKDVRVTRDNIAIFDRFKNNVLEDSESEKALKSKLSNSVNTTINKLRQVTQAYYDGREVDMNPNELIEPTFKLIKDPKTGKVSKVPLDNPNSKNFQRLLRKKESDLTPSEKLTLEAYTTMALVGDADIKMPKEVKKLMFNNFKNEFIVNNNVTEKEFDKFFGNKVEVIEDKFNQASPGLTGTQRKGGFSDGFAKNLKEFGIVSKKDIMGGNFADIPVNMVEGVTKLAELYRSYTVNPTKEVEKKIRDIKNSLNAVSDELLRKKSIGTDYFLSELTGRDMEYNKKDGSEVSLGGINDLMKSTVTELQSDIRELGKQLNLTSQKNLSVTKEDPAYYRLKNELVRSQKIDDSFKGNIEIKYKIGSDGKYTGDADLIVTRKNTGEDKKEKPYVSVGTPVRATDLEAMGIKVQQIKSPAYSALYGKNSKAITLGAGNAADNDDDFVIKNKDILRQQASKVGAKAVVDNMISNYYNGNYRFSISPMDGVYYYTVKDEKGNLLHKVQTEDQEYDETDIVNIYEQAGAVSSELMYSTIQKKIKEFDINSK